MESDRENRKAQESEMRQLEREKTLLLHKQQEMQRKVDMESEKRKQVTVGNAFNILVAWHFFCKYYTLITLRLYTSVCLLLLLLNQELWLLLLAD